MQAFIFADRLGRELEPLTDRACVALLPVVGKPVLEHTLEALAAAGLRRAVVAVASGADGAEKLRAVIGDGRRWGMRLDYAPTSGEEEPESVVERCSSRLEDELLLLRGDVLHGAAVADFLRLAGELAGPVAQGRVAGGSLSLCRHRAGGRAGLEPLRWSGEPSMTPLLWPVVELPGAALNRLESWRAYHRANLDAAAGRFPGLIAPGRAVAPGLTVGLRSEASPHSLRQGVAFIGGACRVEATAELRGEVVVSDRVMIDRYATIQDSVVLPDTYIGERVNVRNAIIQGHQLIQVDTGAIASVVEAFSSADSPDAPLHETLTDPLHRLLGLLALALSLPLWPVALALALATNVNTPLREVKLRSNQFGFDPCGGRRRQVFIAREWAVPVPVLRYLPRLLAVVSGDLRLVGVEPLTPEQADSRVEDWERVSDQAPAGLIGPTALNLPPDAPREQRLLSDAFYARQRSTDRDLRFLLQGVGVLFTRRAWWPV